MAPTIQSLSDAPLRYLLLFIRLIQWLSAVIVIGISASLINHDPNGLAIVYAEIIAVVSVVVFLPGFVSPFLTSPIKDFVLFIDMIFSHLWLAAFIFSAVAYNQKNCRASAAPGVACSQKWANEAFIFLTFIFTFFALFLQTVSLWRSGRKEASRPLHEKNGTPSQVPNTSADGGTGASQEPTGTTENTV